VSRDGRSTSDRLRLRPAAVVCREDSGDPRRRLRANEGEIREEKERDRRQSNDQAGDKFAGIGRILRPSLSPAAEPAAVMEDRRGSHDFLTRKGSPFRVGDCVGADARESALSHASMAMAFAFAARALGPQIVCHAPAG
jgi:hypothetical protein